MKSWKDYLSALILNVNKLLWKIEAKAMQLYKTNKSLLKHKKDMIVDKIIQVSCSKSNQLSQLKLIMI